MAVVDDIDTRPNVAATPSGQSVVLQEHRIVTLRQLPIRMETRFDIHSIGEMALAGRLPAGSPQEQQQVLLTPGPRLEPTQLMPVQKTSMDIGQDLGLMI